MTSDEVFQQLLGGTDPRGRAPEVLQAAAVESRRNYVAAMIELLQQIRVPKVLFWFSVRHPARPQVVSWPPNRHSVLSVAKRVATRLGVLRGPRHWYHDFAGELPHLVNDDMMRAIRVHADAYAECVSNAGLPRWMVSWRHPRVVWDNYYPSPAMHLAAAEALVPVCRDLLIRWAEPEAPCKRGEHPKAGIPESPGL